MMYRFPNEYNEICVPAGAREEFLEKEVADLKEELSRKTEMLCAMEAELRKVSEGQMEWISVDDKPFPRLEKGDVKYYLYSEALNSYMVYSCENNGIVSHWMRIEPPKPKEPTFKDVFLEKFPQAVYPDVDCCTIFPKQFDPNSCDYNCDKCWNLPYIEEEGGEE